MSSIAFFKRFSTEEACLEYLIGIRWPMGVGCIYCGYCGPRPMYKMTPNPACGVGLGVFKCPECLRRFSVTSGTLFHKRKMPLQSILYVVHCVTSRQKRVSATAMAKEVGIQYVPMWAQLMRVRTALYQSGNIILSGVVEVDEAFISKRGQWDRLSYDADKEARKNPVMGLLQRGGPVVIKCIPDRTLPRVTEVIEKHVAPGSVIYTDGHNSYGKLHTNYQHSSVNHSDREFVRGHVHTNGIENVWKHFKGGLRHAHHQVSVKYLQRYCDEFAYRWNTRGMTDSDRFDDAVRRMLTMEPLSREAMKADNSSIKEQKKPKPRREAKGAEPRMEVIHFEPQTQNNEPLNEEDEMSPLASLQFFPGDRLRELMPIINDSEAVGAWCKAWMYLWGSGPSSPEVVAQVAGKGWDRVGFLFDENDGLLSLPWMEKKRAEAEDFRTRQAENGRKGGRPKAATAKAEKPSLSSGITQTKAKKSPRDGDGKEEGYGLKNERAPEVMPFSSHEFNEAWADFVEMREKIRKPMTTAAKRMTLQKLLAMGETKAIASLHASIMNSWQGVFEPKEGSATAKMKATIMDRENPGPSLREYMTNKSKGNAA